MPRKERPTTKKTKKTKKATRKATRRRLRPETKLARQYGQMLVQHARLGRRWKNACIDVQFAKDGSDQEAAARSKAARALCELEEHHEKMREIRMQVWQIFSLHECDRVSAP